MAEPIARRGLRVGARLLARALRVVVEGGEYVPFAGPVLLAAHHYHHLYDGVALLGALRRDVRLVVALDWARTPRQRRLMEALTRHAGWPVLLRPEAFAGGAAGAYADAELAHYTRQGFRHARDCLAGGAAVAMFPEGYPSVDPHGTRKPGDAGLLPFRTGFARLARAAARRARAPIPVLPVGFDYGAGPIRMRIGPPVAVDARADVAAIVALVERQVHGLCGPSNAAPGRTA